MPRAAGAHHRGAPPDVTLPAAVRAGLETALGGQITGTSRVSGGCISPAARLETADGRLFFAKWGEGAEPDGLFAAESRGLESLRETGAVRVPDAIAVDDAWLLLEWLAPGDPAAETWPGLGRDLAALHAVRADTFGDVADNFIGPLPQSNAQGTDWPAFWRDRRLAPQLDRAAGAFPPRQADRLERFIRESLDGLLAIGNEDGPSRLHGDLWGGNVLVTESGRAALIDPSAYDGHREVDLAMADLFGGFDRSFFDAYHAEWPLSPGWRERRAAYQLYYLLVHVNLFGVGYADRTLKALEAAGG